MPADVAPRRLAYAFASRVIGLLTGLGEGLILKLYQMVVDPAPPDSWATKLFARLARGPLRCAPPSCPLEPLPQTPNPKPWTNSASPGGSAVCTPRAGAAQTLARPAPAPCAAACAGCWVCRQLCARRRAAATPCSLGSDAAHISGTRSSQCCCPRSAVVSVMSLGAPALAAGWPASWAARALMQALPGACRQVIKEFLAASGDFTRRLTSIEVNSKFSSPLAGPEEYFSVRGPLEQ